MDKKILRREMRARRKSLTEMERQNFSDEITKKFLALDVYKSSSVVMAYVSMPEEVQLQKIFVDAFEQKKILAVPLIIGKGEMSAVEVPNFDALEIGEFGILTVREDSRKFIDAEKINCVIVPGAAFDIHKNRLGLGGGFYDKFLPRAVNAKKIALAYDFQIVDAVPTEPHDSPVDMIITEKRILK
jgi:5-formyltetrahydrofolate cyclo-ligase